MAEIKQEFTDTGGIEEEVDVTVDETTEKVTMNNIEQEKKIMSRVYFLMWA